MSNSKTNTRSQIEKTRAELELLEQLDQLESEFRLIENEYRQRHQDLTFRLETLQTIGDPALLTP